MKDFARASIIRRDFFGFDSIQGLLELATWYDEGKDVHFVFSRKTSKYSHRLLDTLKQLEREGYVTLQFSDTEDGHMCLESITLTINGHKLLAELREKSAAGKLKRRLGDLVWVILTSILTTLAVLWVKGT
jgi:hypothetical protein